jgi:hypothetical protein
VKFIIKRFASLGARQREKILKKSLAKPTAFAKIAQVEVDA